MVNAQAAEGQSVLSRDVFTVRVATVELLEGEFVHHGHAREVVFGAGHDEDPRPFLAGDTDARDRFECLTMHEDQFERRMIIGVSFGRFREGDLDRELRVRQFSFERFPLRRIHLVYGHADTRSSDEPFELPERLEAHFDCGIVARFFCGERDFYASSFHHGDGPFFVQGSLGISKNALFVNRIGLFYEGFYRKDKNS